jgi:hypothetical protein
MSSLERLDDDRWQLRPECGVVSASVSLGYDRAAARGYRAQFRTDGSGRAVDVDLGSGEVLTVETGDAVSPEQHSWVVALRELTTDLWEELLGDVAMQAAALADLMTADPSRPPNGARYDPQAWRRRLAPQLAPAGHLESIAAELRCLAAALEAGPVRRRAIRLLETGWSGPEQELIAAASVEDADADGLDLKIR